MPSKLSESDDLFHPSIDRLLPIEKTLLIVGIGRTKWLEMVAAGTGVKPVKPDKKMVRWKLSELQQWIAKLGSEE